MFDHLEEFENQGHFFFNKGDNLIEKSAEVPDLPGVYYILRLASGGIDVVYIAKSGTMQQKGSFKQPLLKKCFTDKKEGAKKQQYLEKKMKQESIDGLDIYWFVTYDDNDKVLPGLMEANMMQQYVDLFGCLPPWNKEF